MAKKMTALRLDEDLVARSRELVGPRGLTKLIEELLGEYLARPRSCEGSENPDDHRWHAKRGASGLVVVMCRDCGALRP